jgi:transcriptional regulator GlxA family with amidase domain/YHS domain-containing protein
MKKLKIIFLIIGALIAVAIGSFYGYYRATQKTIAILLYDNFTLLDAVGSYQTASGLMLKNYSIKFVAKQKGRVKSSYMQSLNAEYDFNDISNADILIIPGGENAELILKDEETMNWIRKIDAKSDYTLSLGSGTVVLASTGVLEGKQATANWYDKTALEKSGATYVSTDYLHDGKYYTGMGASASIDMVLGLINDIADADLSKTTQLFIAYDPQAPVHSGFYEQADSTVKSMATALRERKSSDRPKKIIAMYLYKGFTMLDVTGPYQVFRELEGLGYEMKFIADEKGIIKSDFIQSLETPYSIKDITSADVFFVPGGSTTFKILDDTALVDWVKQIDATTQFTTSVCTGSVLLGEAGFLKGRSATSHWYVGPMLNQFGATYSNARYTKDGKYITGAGVSAGIDLALFVVKELEGENVAKAIQLKIGYHPNPPFDAGTPEKSDKKTVEMLSQMFTSATQRGGTKKPTTAVAAIALDSDIDPVCNMNIKGTHADTILYKGKVYGFCSAICKESFKNDPEKFLSEK